MDKEKNSGKILITIGWLSVILAFVSFPIFLGIVAICMGIVLRRDYQKEKHGYILIVFGIIGGISGSLFAFLL